MYQNLQEGIVSTNNYQMCWDGTHTASVSLWIANLVKFMPFSRDENVSVEIAMLEGNSQHNQSKTSTEERKR